MSELSDYIDARTVQDGDCLRWTGYLLNGHPSGTIGGRKVLIRRALHEARRGAIRKGRVMRCICDTPLCVAEAHAKLSTYQRIAQDCGAQGLMSGLLRSAHIAEAKRASSAAKITQADARSIRATDEPVAVVAQRYGIAPATVSKIRRGQVRREFVGNVWGGL